MICIDEGEMKSVTDPSLKDGGIPVVAQWIKNPTSIKKKKKMEFPSWCSGNESN